MHVTALMATASLLVKAKEKWSGILTFIFQPNEENGAGAMAMVNDGLYKYAPKPDIASSWLSMSIIGGIESLQFVLDPASQQLTPSL